MKVLLLGATGNLGSRLVPALLTHNHTVIAFVRSANKLESLLPSSVYQQITVVEGDAKDSSSITKAILENGCDAVVSAAGVAAMAPWGQSDLPAIFRSVLDAVQAAGTERGTPLRVWFLAGFSILYYPGTESMMLNQYVHSLRSASSFIHTSVLTSSSMPIYLEHRQNIALLEALPPNTVDWSMLCPMTMTPESTDLSVPTKTQQGKMVANAASPPLWNESWLSSIPLIGKTLAIGMNASRYETTLEQNAELIAADLESHESRWSGKKVGVIDGSK